MMRLLTILLAVLFLSGCFLANGINRIDEMQTMQEKASESYPRKLSESFEHEKSFMKCMQDYGKANAGSTIDTLAMADAAVVNCKTSLTLYELALHSYYLNKSVALGESPDYYQENNKYKLQDDLNQLTIKGKRETISEVVKARSKK